MKITRKMGTVSGDALIFGAMLFFGTYSLFIRLRPLPIFTYLLAFQIVGAMAFFIWAAFRKQKIRTDRILIPSFIGLAVSATLNDLTYFYAFQETTVAKAAISHQMVSVFLLALAPLVVKERTTKREWGAMIFALFGIILLFSDKNVGSSKNDLLGIALGLTSAFFYACIILFYRRLQNEFQLSLTTINTWRYCLSAIFLLPFIPIMAAYSYTSTDFAVLVFFGVLFAVVASGLHCLGMGMTKALHSSIIGKSEPVFAVFYAYLFLHETPAPPTIFGGVIVMAASLWLSMQKEMPIAREVAAK